MRSDAIDPTPLGQLLPIPGVGTRSQWEDVGASRNMFTDGRLVQVVRGLYTLPGATPPPRELINLIRPTIPACGVITGWASALLQGVRDAGPTMRTLRPEPIQLCLGRHEHRVPPGCTTLRVDAESDHIITVEGFPVTSLARTAYDMIRFSRSEEAALTIADCFLSDLSQAPLAVSAISEIERAHPRSRGNPRVRRVVAWSSPRTRSIPESRVRLLLVNDLGLDPSMILVNATLRVDGVPVAEFDLIDLVSGVVFEYDGEHHASPEQRASDARKDALVHELGLHIVRLTAADLRRPRPRLIAELGRRIRAAIESGAGARACRLVADGQLSEEPLVTYPQTQ